MKFSPQQDNALVRADRWYRESDKQVFHLFGYAGTGKTTLAKHLAQNIDGEVLFGAYTGKAAHVLRTKGCHNAATLHSMIYRSRDKSKERLKELENERDALINELMKQELTPEQLSDHPKIRKLRRLIEEEAKNSSQPNFILNHDSPVKDASIVMIDECSMVDGQMAQDLLSFGTPVLVMGDPAQLPPVGGAGYFTENINPDIMLDEIHRQAQESPIIRMATKVRNQELLELGDWGNDCFVYAKGTKLPTDQILGYDQILVGKNATRHLTNSKIRKLLDVHDKYPVIGDRLVCLRNNSELGLLNGAIFMATSIDGVMDGKVHMTVQPEDSQMNVSVAALEQHFLGKGKDLNAQYWLRSEGQEFDYGYALTVHKSQGSQWESVCVFDESGVFRDQKYRWLYTAITRAAENVSVIRM